MKQRVCVVGAALIVTACPATTQANIQPQTKKTYLSLYRETVERHGTRAPGRNIIKDGVETKNGTRPAHHTEVRKSIEVLQRMLYTPPPATTLTTTPPAVNTEPLIATQPTPTARTATPSASINTPHSGKLPYCTWGPESGGNYRARNPSGAGGKYQIMPGTWKAYGGTGANAADASPAEQDRVAQRIYNAEGGRPWVNC